VVANASGLASAVPKVVVAAKPDGKVTTAISIATLPSAPVIV
jgi:hypothetical protein